MSLLHRRPLSVLGALVLLIALLAAITTTEPRASATTVSAAEQPNRTTASPRVAKPTIVLVHGAWADSSGWSAELNALRAKGYTAIALANRLRGLSSDSAYIRSVLDTIDGPVVLVGHSYGGAVMSGAAAGATTSRRWSTSRRSCPTKVKPWVS